MSDRMLWRYLSGRSVGHALPILYGTTHGHTAVCGVAPVWHDGWQGDDDAQDRAHLAALPTCRRCARALAATALS